MSEPIKVGDLVVVVKPGPCGCGQSESIGRIFRVGEIRPARNGCTECTRCGKLTRSGAVALQTGERLVYGLYRLRRIPPLAELDSIERKEETPA